MSKLIYTIDVESDLHTERHRGITKGLLELEKICDKHGVRPTLFVVASIIPKNKEIFRRFHRKGWEISLHGFSHKRFDDMPYKEKEKELKDSIKIFKKHLGIKPKGFRAPQHSIDSETLDLLDKYGFEYDSSYTPFNLLQLAFFPTRLKIFFTQFFSRPNPYKIRENLMEIPVPSLILPPVSLVVRVFPVWFLKIYFKTLCLMFKKPVFYAHSWDFIELKDSRIDRLWSNAKLLNKLDMLMLQTHGN